MLHWRARRDKHLSRLINITRSLTSLITPLLLSPSLTELCISKFLPTKPELTSGRKYRWWSTTLEKLEVVEWCSGVLHLTLTTACVYLA